MINKDLFLSFFSKYFVSILYKFFYVLFFGTFCQTFNFNQFYYQFEQLFSSLNFKEKLLTQFFLLLLLLFFGYHFKRLRKKNIYPSNVKSENLFSLLDNSKEKNPFLCVCVCLCVKKLNKS